MTSESSKNSTSATAALAASDFDKTTLQELLKIVARFGCPVSPKSLSEDDIDAFFDKLEMSSKSPSMTRAQLTKRDLQWLFRSRKIVCRWPVFLSLLAKDSDAFLQEGVAASMLNLLAFDEKECRVSADSWDWYASSQMIMALCDTAQRLLLFAPPSPAANARLIAFFKRGSQNEADGPGRTLLLLGLTSIRAMTRARGIAILIEILKLPEPLQQSIGLIRDDDRIVKRLLKLLRLASERLATTEQYLSDHGGMPERVFSFAERVIAMNAYSPPGQEGQSNEQMCTEFALRLLWDMTHPTGLQMFQRQEVVAKLIRHGAIGAVMTLLGSFDYLFKASDAGSTAASSSSAAAAAADSASDRGDFKPSIAADASSRSQQSEKLQRADFVHPRTFANAVSFLQTLSNADAACKLILVAPNFHVFFDLFLLGKAPATFTAVPLRASERRPEITPQLFLYNVMLLNQLLQAGDPTVLKRYPRLQLWLRRVVETCRAAVDLHLPREGKADGKQSAKAKEKAGGWEFLEAQESTMTLGLIAQLLQRAHDLGETLLLQFPVVPLLIRCWKGANSLSGHNQMFVKRQSDNALLSLTEYHRRLAVDAIQAAVNAGDLTESELISFANAWQLSVEKDRTPTKGLEDVPWRVVALCVQASAAVRRSVEQAQRKLAKKARGGNAEQLWPDLVLSLAAQSEWKQPPPPTVGLRYSVEDALVRCAACDKLQLHAGEFKKCARCLAVRYCSQECQRSHWKAGHKAECKPAEAASSDLAG